MIDVPTPPLNGTSVTDKPKKKKAKGKTVEFEGEPEFVEYYVQAVNRQTGHSWRWSSRKFRGIEPAKNHMYLADKKNKEPGIVYHRIISESFFIKRDIAFTPEDHQEHHL